MNKFLKGDIYILLACLFWGSSQTLTTVALKGMTLFNFVGFRFLIGSIVLGVFSIKYIKNINKQIVVCSLISSIFLWCGLFLEMMGLNFIGPIKTGFLISMDTIFIPIIYFLIYKTRIKTNEILGLIIAFIGLVIINYTGVVFGINLGIVITLLSAIFYAIYTVTLGQFVKKYEVRALIVLQLLFVSIFSFIASIFERNTTHAINIDSVIAVIIAGIFCSGLSYFLQALGQKSISPIRVGMLFCTAPLFGMIASWVVLKETLSATGMIGALFIIIGLISENLNLNKALKNNKSFEIQK